MPDGLLLPGQRLARGVEPAPARPRLRAAARVRARARPARRRDRPRPAAARSGSSSASRAATDFVSDLKWGGYLDWCDRFFWAVDADFPDRPPAPRRRPDPRRRLGRRDPALARAGAARPAPAAAPSPSASPAPPPAGSGRPGPDARRGRSLSAVEAPAEGLLADQAVDRLELRRAPRRGSGARPLISMISLRRMVAAKSSQPCATITKAPGRRSRSPRSRGRGRAWPRPARSSSAGR